MAFNYQAQPLPILEPGQMNPFNQAIQSGLNTFQQGIKSAYLPQGLQSDIEKKQAYTEYMKNMPMQYVSSVLSNPQLVPFMSNEQRSGLIDMLARRANATAQPEKLHTKDGLLNWIKNSFSSQPEQSQLPPQDAQQINAMQPGQSYVVGSGRAPQQTDMGKATGYTNFPPAFNPIGQQPNQPKGYIDPSSPVANAYGRDFGNAEANRFQADQHPSAAFDQQNKAQQAAASEEAKEGVKIWNEELSDSRKEAKSAKSALDQVTRFSNLYDKLSPVERGFGLGSVKALSSDAQLVDNIANNLALDLASERFKQRITNNDLQYSQTLKTNRSLNPNAKKDMVNFLTSANQRVIEQAAFKNAAKNRGLSPSEADLVWQKYIDERPLYNTATGKLQPKNARGWSEFLQPNKVREALNPQNSYPNSDYAPPQEVINETKPHDPLGFRK